MAALLATLMVVSTAFAQSAMGADQAAPPKLPGERALPGETGGPYPDPLEPFNSTMFNFNINVDQYVVTPVAKGYSYVLPEPARQSVNNFFRNIGVIPRFANNLFQLHIVNAGDELARFGINSTLGVAGLFDVADSWFGMKQHNDDFGLTLGHYGIYSGPYIMLAVPRPLDGPRYGRLGGRWPHEPDELAAAVVCDGARRHRFAGDQRGELPLAASQSVRRGRPLRGRPVRRGAGCVHADADCGA